MREALLGKRYGIPAALLIVLLLSGTALAWYCFCNASSGTTVQEPLSVNELSEFSANMDPGETNTWTFDIVNSANIGYDIKADLTFTHPSGVSITAFVVYYPDTDNHVYKTSDLTDDGSAEFSIDTNARISCSMTISAAKDAEPGDVTVTLNLSRK